MDGEKDKNESPEASVPPKLDLKQAVASQNQAPKKATTRIEMASAAMIPEEKSKTTRINLGSFGVDPASTPKTIKIQRPSEASTIKLNRPGTSLGTPPVPLTPAAPPPSQAQAKRQTSRISLQEALTPPAEGQAPAASAQPLAETSAPSGGPKTIRIKRPGDGAGAAPESVAAPATAAEPAADSGPPTQRKTIKLRRPGSGADGETVHHAAVLPKSAADFAAAQAAGEQEDTNEPGVWFGVLSIAATLVCATLVYLLCVQALPTLGLTWPGQVPTLR
jgi:hypothetical protein